ncbi:hypothetical protein DL96DRAFT_1522051 [Flagelloscypha sp. PMI_526]|nr:hypothetical protein DL96DRAFT_1522051 [Flagelloscypha sp. PMI_526]
MLGPFVSLSVLLASAVQVYAQDPCAAIAGKTFIAPAALRACEKSFPFNETLRQNILTNGARILNDFFTFKEYYSNSPAPFQESTVNIAAELKRINTTKYKTDYDFNWDLYKFSNSLNDGHTKWYPDCYTSVQSILPAPVISLAVNGTESLYIAPDLLEFIPLLGDEYLGYLESVKFDYKPLAGAKVISIEGLPAYTYIDKVAHEVSGNFLDHGIRVNSAYTSYRISGGAWSQRLGDLAGPTGVEKDSLTFTVILAGTTKPKTITVPYVAAWAGYDFTDKESFWANNCAVKEDTNGYDWKDAGTSSFSPNQPDLRRQPIGNVKEGAGKSTSVGLPEPYQPTIPSAPGSSDVVWGYVLEGNQTAVLFVASFSPADFYGFQAQVDSLISSFLAAGATNLIIDLTDNGGGYVCLGQYLFKYLVGSNHVGNPGFQSTTRDSAPALKILEAEIALGLNAAYAFYTADNYADLETNTMYDPSYNYMDPVRYETVNGQQMPVSERYFDTCEYYFETEVPAEPPFALENIVIAGNSWCASTCAMFTTLMSEKAATKIASFGAKPGEAMEYKGMAGNQVLDWFYLASEIKTADLENDPTMPPDLLVSGDFRVNWRTAYSWIDESKPIAYRSDLAKYRFPYTPETYNNPQNVWTFVESQFFKNKSSSRDVSPAKRAPEGLVRSSKFS